MMVIQWCDFDWIKVMVEDMVIIVNDFLDQRQFECEVWIFFDVDNVIKLQNQCFLVFIYDKD